MEYGDTRAVGGTPMELRVPQKVKRSPLFFHNEVTGSPLGISKLMGYSH